MNLDTMELKRKLTDMFCWFHNFCEENELRYYALGGTMLGAVRHQGFIPWDDDIDIGMPRADYTRLAELLKDHTGRYILETPQSSNPDYFYPLSKLYDTETTLIENTRCKIRRGIFLDIFPLDGAGNTLQEAETTFQKVWCKRKLLLAMTTGYRNGRSLYKNLAVFAARLIPSWIINRKKLLLDLDALCAEKDFDSCKYIGNFYGAWGMREVMPRRFLGNPTVYSFENRIIYGAEDFDSYLTSLYRNWQQLPPVEKRVSHHDFLYFNLDKSYLTQQK